MKKSVKQLRSKKNLSTLETAMLLLFNVIEKRKADIQNGTLTYGIERLEFNRFLEANIDKNIGNCNVTFNQKRIDKNRFLQNLQGLDANCQLLQDGLPGINVQSHFDRFENGDMGKIDKKRIFFILLYEFNGP